MSQPPTPSGRTPECFATAARKASRRLTQFYDEALEPSGLRSTQYAILAELTRSEEPPTLAELASTLVSDRSAVGHNLRPLRGTAMSRSTRGRRTGANGGSS